MHSGLQGESERVVHRVESTSDQLMTFGRVEVWSCVCTGLSLSVGVCVFFLFVRVFFFTSSDHL